LGCDTVHSGTFLRNGGYYLPECAVSPAIQIPPGKPPNVHEDLKSAADDSAVSTLDVCNEVGLAVNGWGENGS
jgi:hypothetical protein